MKFELNQLDQQSQTRLCAYILQLDDIKLEVQKQLTESVSKDAQVKTLMDSAEKQLRQKDEEIEQLRLSHANAEPRTSTHPQCV